MKHDNDEMLLLQKEFKKLKKIGRTLYKEQSLCYGQLRGFRKAVSILVHDELDGGESRELNAIETNIYKMPR